MSAALTFNPDIARPFLETLEQIHLVYIHPNGVGVHGREFHTNVDEALAAAAKANADGFNIYWTVNIVRPGLNRKPSKADITHARFVHVDIDPPKSGGAFDKSAIASALLDIDKPPSLIIDSGGGLQAFWRLDDPCANLPSIEAINVQARDWLDDNHDGTWNIDRLMRVPGSINWPDKKKKLAGRVPKLATMISPYDGVVYSPEELAASFPAAQPTAGKSDIGMTISLPADVILITPDDLGLSALDPIRMAIETPPGHDRSGDGLAAARLMANAGFPDAQIMGALLNPANTVSAHYLDQRDPRRAVARSIQLVRLDGPPSGEALHAPIMSDADFAVFVANCKAKVRKAMVPAELRQDDPDDGGPLQRIGMPGWQRDLGDGALAQFVSHTCASAPSPQPWLTLGAGLAMFGAAAGRRYAGPTNLRTNIYSIGVADSGGGKDHPLRAITRLMIAAGLQTHVGSSKIASGSGLVTAITRNPSIVFPLDEVGFLIASAADRRRAPKHLTEIIDNLTEFYSLADSTFLGTAYANDKEKPREVIEQPCLCMFGVTTPAVFWGSLSSGNVMDGSLARMLIFESENHYPDPQHALASNTPPDSLIAAVEAISRGADGANPFPMGNGSSIVPKPFMVPYADAGAEATARAMRETQIEMLRAHQGSQLTGIIARLAENAAKIGLIRAITENAAAPRITIAHLNWGMDVANRSVETLMNAVKERVADNEYEALVKRLLRVISDAGSAGIDGTSLSRKTQFLDRRKRADIITGLMEAGMIRATKIAKSAEGGTDKMVYFDIS